MSWTPENIERVRALAGEGFSISQIAAQLGVSRNAIAGVGGRYGISFHGTAYPATARPSRTKPIAIVSTEPRMVQFADLGFGDCRFPLGDSDFRFCALPALEDSPYCERHALMTTQRK